MRIDYNKPVNEFQKWTYYDMNGDEIREGDVVLMDGREWDVMSTADGYLGVDSTNPTWVEHGRAFKGQFGVYPFEERDTPVIKREV